MKRFKYSMAALLLLTLPFDIMAAGHSVTNTVPVAEGSVMNAETEAIKEVPFVGGAELKNDGTDDESYVVWTLATLREDPLTAADFVLGEVSPGDDFQRLVQYYGAPEEVHKGNIDDYYLFEDAAATVRRGVPFNDTTAIKIGIDPARVTKGVAALYTETERHASARGLAVGNSRENILRIYGRPATVDFEPRKQVLYYTYFIPEENLKMVFATKNFQIHSIRSEKITINEAEMIRAQQNADEFRLADLKVGKVFAAPAWSEWEIHAEQDKKEFWLFKDFGVYLDKKTQKIERIFLRSPHIATARGITLGDSITTVEHVYGNPQILEFATETAPHMLYYADPKQRDCYLVFAIDPQRTEVVDILLSNGPIRDRDTKEERYGISRSE